MMIGGLYSALLERGFKPTHSFHAFSRLMAVYAAENPGPYRYLGEYVSGQGLDSMGVVLNMPKNLLDDRTDDFGFGYLTRGKDGQVGFASAGYEEDGLFPNHPDVPPFAYEGRVQQHSGEDVKAFGDCVPRAPSEHFTGGFSVDFIDDPLHAPPIRGHGFEGALNLVVEHTITRGNHTWAQRSDGKYLVHGMDENTLSVTTTQKCFVIPMCDVRSGKTSIASVAGCFGVSDHLFLGSGTLAVTITVSEVSASPVDHPEIPANLLAEGSVDPSALKGYSNKDWTVTAKQSKGAFNSGTFDSLYAKVKAAYGSQDIQSRFDVFGNVLTFVEAYGPRSMSLCSRPGGDYLSVFWYGATMQRKLQEMLEDMNARASAENKINVGELRQRAAAIGRNFGYFLKVCQNPVNGPKNVWEEVPFTRDFASKDEFLDSEMQEGQTARQVANRIKGIAANHWAQAAYVRSDSVSFDYSGGQAIYSDGSDIFDFEEAKRRVGEEGAEFIYGRTGLPPSGEPAADAILAQVELLRLLDATTPAANGTTSDRSVEDWAGRPKGMEWVQCYSDPRAPESANTLLQTFRFQCTPMSLSDFALLGRSSATKFEVVAASGPELPKPEMLFRSGPQELDGIPGKAVAASHFTGEIFTIPVAMGRPVGQNFSGVRWPRSKKAAVVKGEFPGMTKLRLHNPKDSFEGGLMVFESEGGEVHWAFYEAQRNLYPVREMLAFSELARRVQEGQFEFACGGYPNAVSWTVPDALKTAWTSRMDAVHLYYIPGVGSGRIAGDGVKADGVQGCLPVDIAVLDWDMDQTSMSVVLFCWMKGSFDGIPVDGPGYLMTDVWNSQQG